MAEAGDGHWPCDGTGRYSRADKVVRDSVVTGVLRGTTHRGPRTPATGLPGRFPGILELMARPRNNPGDLAELPTELRTDRPKGDQIREILENLTRSLAVGTVLPSERVLAERFGVARMTVRQEVDRVVAEGLANRRPGGGTFVAEPRPSRMLASSFTQDMVDRGIKPGAKVLEHRVGAADEDLTRELEEPIDEEEFLFELKEKMHAHVIRHTTLLGKNVKRVAVCGGAGGFLLKQAIAAGADVFVTADYKYHEFFDADSNIIIADIGHYESEVFTKELLKDVLMKKFPTFAINFSNTVTNPISYT